MTPKIGTKFELNSAEGRYTYRVLRPHRDVGFYETVIVSGGHTARHRSIQVLSKKDILAALLPKAVR